MSTANGIVEHIVLFKIKVNAETSKVNAMIDSLNSLQYLPSVLHLTTGPLLLIKTSPFHFSQVLHGRYTSKDGLASYSRHPDHVAVVNNRILPICDDMMAIDWVVDGIVPVSLPPGSGVRLMFLKLKEGFEKDRVLGILKGREFGGGVVQVSIGENFSPGRSKGFTVAILVVFKGVKEMEGVNFEDVLIGVRDCLESVVVLDFVVPSIHSSSL